MARKSFKEEIQVIKYMTDLAGPTFKYLQGMYDAGDKEDKKWAVEQMMKLYAKAIPTELATDGALKIMVVKYGDQDSLPMDAGKTSTPDNTESGKIQSDSLAQESS